MSGLIAIVHDDDTFRSAVVSALAAEGYRVIEYCDPYDAYEAAEALQDQQDTTLLITLTTFAEGRGNGAGLAVMLKMRTPDMQVLFLALPDAAMYVDDLGPCLKMPVPIPDLLSAVRTIIEGPESAS